MRRNKPSAPPEARAGAELVGAGLAQRDQLLRPAKSVKTLIVAINVAGQTLAHGFCQIANESVTEPSRQPPTHDVLRRTHAIEFDMITADINT